MYVRKCPNVWFSRGFVISFFCLFAFCEVHVCSTLVHVVVFFWYAVRHNVRDV